MGDGDGGPLGETSAVGERGKPPMERSLGSRADKDELEESEWEGIKGTGVSVDPHSGTKTTACGEPLRGEVWARVPSAGLGAPLTVQPPGRA